jgi:predicted regulator of Ras-like GTPase activity (Roadblock/LC7/MglB family)
MQFGGDIGLTEADLAKLEPEIAYITANCEIDSIALVSETGYQVAYAAVPGYNVDSDALCGIASALTMTSKMGIETMFNESLSEIIVRAGNGYLVVTNAGRFVIVGAGRQIDKMMKTVKVFRVAAQRIASLFPTR